MPLSYANYTLGVTIFVSIWFGLPLLVLLLYLFRRFRVVEQGTSMIVERLGRFHRRCDAGLHFLVPFIDRPRPVVWRNADVYLAGNHTQVVQVTELTRDIIDLRESIMDFPNQPVITRDNVQIAVHPMLLYRLVDPVRVAYETYDLCHAVEKLVQTTLRSIIGEMGLDDTLASREEIEKVLKSKIARVCFDWGLEIRSVELLEITPTPLVQGAMHKQLAAERIRRAAIVSAEGNREQTKLEAEGASQSQIALATGDKQVSTVRAQGQADARKLLARAEADAIRIIAAALQEFGVDPTGYIIGMKYIDALTSLACSAGKREIYFPLQTDVSGALGSIGEGVRRVAGTRA